MHAHLLRPRLGGRTRSRSSCATSPRRGHEIASHGYAHRLVYDQTRGGLSRGCPPRQAAARGRHRHHRGGLSGAELLGHAPIAVGARHSHRGRATATTRASSRFATIATAFPRSPRHPYASRGAGGSIVEVPGSTVRLGPLNLPMAGAGTFAFFRMRWTRWGIARLNRLERQPAVFYIHPWEIDPDQPRLPAGWLGRFRHYRNLHQDANAGCAPCSRIFSSAPSDTLLQTRCASRSRSRSKCARAVRRTSW